MPTCLHPFNIRHPTLKKFQDEVLYPLHLSDAEYFRRSEEFCAIHHIEKEMKIPCGKCIYCYQRKQEVWRIRLQQEQKSSFVSFFVTLTYDDDNLPNDGVSKTDFQKFMKRFRHNMMIPLRYFAVSEYGPNNTHRPHYHFALFFKDFVSLEDVYLELEKSWHSIISIGELTDGRIDYLSTYCIKFFNEAPVGKISNFMLCSRRPFIGSGFLTSEMCNNVRVKMVPFISVNGFKKPFPRIYKEKIFDDEMVIALREKMEDYQKKTYEERIKFYASSLEYSQAVIRQYSLDYRKAWRKFKESKKL